MAKGNRSSKPISNLFRGSTRFFRNVRRVMARSLQSWAIQLNRRSRHNQAGFVLPTVTMVMLVVVLLSLAITFRAFDRAKDARFTRVSEATLQAATPAVDRARAKIAKVLRELDEDPTAEISDQDIYKTLTSGAYTFPDEQVLQVSYDIDDNGSIQPNGVATDNNGLLGTEDAEIRDNEQITTAWRFPLDTNNNGAFDSFTLYGIYFRNPEIGAVRTPLDARTLPLPPFDIDDRQECAFVSGSNDNLVTDEGWVPMTGKLKKSFFVYTVSVPIDNEDMISNGGAGEYEILQGASGFSPLEYQQEWAQRLFTGVVYQDDLEIAPGPEFNFNGSLLTKSNLIISHFGNGLTLYQVSSKDSCFYQEDLSKIQVAGNVINDMVGRSDKRNAAEVHLFQGRDNNPITANIEDATQSINGGGTDNKLYLYNDAAYETRLEKLVSCQLDNAAASDPPQVIRTVASQMGEDPTLTEAKARRDQLTNYFSNRLRKVPIAEVAIGVDEGLNGCGYLEGTEETLAPPEEWADIDQSEIEVNPDQPEATEPGEQEEAGVEAVLGDRLKVGINLPALELNDDDKWVPTTKLLGTWTNGEDRTRVTEAEPLPSAGDLTRDGFWEKAAAAEPATALKGIGGLRVITGAGYYDPAESFLRDPDYSFPPLAGTYDDPATAITETFTQVWPDTMPMSYPDPDETNLKGDLQMRATAVYHYAQDAFNPPDDTVQEPIACVSSYYDPSTSITAVNKNFLPWNNTASGDGRSNNGIVYGPPVTARPTGATLNNTNGLITIAGAVPELANQANYVFPDGRFANEPLRDALISLSEGVAPDNLTLSQQAAIDSTLCAIDIANNDLTPDESLIPHGAIREVAMLNAREIKAIHADNTGTTVDETFTLSSPLNPDPQAAELISEEYDLPLEDRQPLEIRLTVIDLDAIRQRTIPSNLGVEGLEEEFLLPYSGIIYASRDDALPDRSDRTPNDAGDAIDENQSAAISPVDFKLDPTRRPNGILLVNGKSLWRNESYNEVQEVLKEKGLTLVSNLPVYIQAQQDGNTGVFNSHDILEFGEDELEWGFGAFYNREGPAQDFACRQGDPIREDLNYPCGGDNWRPATIFADAITLLSDNYRFGYRNEGDFDHRNNAANAIVGYDWDGGLPAIATIAENDVQLDLDGDGVVGTATLQEDQVTAKIARQLNGFNGYNDFVVNGLSSGADFDIEDDPENDGEINNINNRGDLNDASYRNNDNDAVDSSYFNNFVTPIQRRGEFPEYVMEICKQFPVSACQPGDWVVTNAGGTTKPASQAITDGDTYNNIDGSGTTAREPSPGYQRYPRRVAFLRDPANNQLELDADDLPIPIAIDTGDNVECYYSGNGDGGNTQCNAFNATNIKQPDNALWFKTNNGGENWGSDHPLFYYDLANPGTSRPDFSTAGVQQPLLVPVLQIYTTDNTPQGNEANLPEGASANIGTRWLPRPERDIEFNLVMGAGDVPGRPLELNGGLQNLPRVLENWQTPNQRSTTILGSFVQTGRSKYATAPYLSAKDDLPLFGTDQIRYNIANAQRRIPYFTPPERNWGYDVGLLSQPPDYFARKFAQLESEQVCKENEDGEIESCDKQYTVTQYFKEVGKDDRWVKGLLCSKVLESGDNAASDNVRGSQCEKNGYE